MRGVEQLPGPALGEWLVHALRASGAAVLRGPGSDLGRTGRELFARVAEVAGVHGWPVLAGGEAWPCAALVVVRALGGDAVEPEVAGAVADVSPGGLVVELGHPPAVRPWQVWTWLRRARVLRAAAEQRARAWLTHGLYGVEQWAPVDMPRVLVTCGRRRAIPRA